MKNATVAAISTVVIAIALAGAANLEGARAQPAAAPKSAAAAPPPSLKLGRPSIGAHCYCHLTCGGGSPILNQFTDPNHTYTQLGNLRNQQCLGYCKGRLDGMSAAEKVAAFQQCKNNVCYSKITMWDAIGTQGYRETKSNTAQGAIAYSCPTGQTLAFDNAKCGTLLGPAFPSSMWDQYLQPNLFVTAGKVYQITQSSAHSCTF